MARTTPYGSLSTKPVELLSASAGMAPSMVATRPAMSRIKSVAILMLAPPQSGVAPVSSLRYEISSSFRSIIKSAAFQKMSRRWAGVVLRHDLKAAAALSTAARASAVLALPHWCSTLPEAGETTSNFLSGWTSLPLIQKGTGPAVSLLDCVTRSGIVNCEALIWFVRL